MNMKSILTGFAAGAINGLLGTGGGMILVPMLARNPAFKNENIFRCSIAVMLPVSIITLLFTFEPSVFQFTALPSYLIGSGLGGLMASRKPLPLIWLHRLLGILILWGGIRSLC